MAAVPANFNFQIRSTTENVLHDLYDITNMQNVMILPHSELLCLKSARIAWTI